ncbi:MAG: DUF302 domain-containing protein [Candidatus Competibacteraceae bacterium]
MKITTEFDTIKKYGAGKPVKGHKHYLLVSMLELLLPCHVVIRQGEAGKVRVDLINSGTVLDRVGKLNISPLADEATQRRERVRQVL